MPNLVVTMSFNDIVGLVLFAICGVILAIMIVIIKVLEWWDRRKKSK